MSINLKGNSTIFPQKVFTGLGEYCCVLYVNFFFIFKVINQKHYNAMQLSHCNLSDYMQLPLELQRTLNYFFHIYTGTPQDL